MCFESKALGFKRDRPAARERVQNRWWLAVTGCTDLTTGPLEDRFVVGVLPFDEVFDDLEQALAFGLLYFFSRELVRM